ARSRRGAAGPGSGGCGVVEGAHLGATRAGRPWAPASERNHPMTPATVIIGANLGDEGKGLLTDFHAAAAPGALIVRFNGGAQAGHTVVTPDARRHVFSHFGSGSFAGAATYLSRFFVSHPTLFLRERAQLAALGLAPTVHVDPRSPITTPYDMLINQAVETARAGARHGSCGIGFGETIQRGLAPRLALQVGDLVVRGWRDRFA